MYTPINNATKVGRDVPGAPRAYPTPIHPTTVERTKTQIQLHPPPIFRLFRKFRVFRDKKTPETPRNTSKPSAISTISIRSPKTFGHFNFSGAKFHISTQQPENL